MANKKNKQTTQTPETLEDMLGGKDSFVVRNQKKMLYGAGAVVVVVLAVIAYFQLYRNPRIQAANEAIYPAQQLFAAQQYAAALNGDSTGVKGFLAVGKQYSGTDAANLCHAYAAVCYNALGKTQEAIAEAEQYSQAGDQSISPAVTGALANLYITAGQADKGLTLLDKAASEASDMTLRSLYLRQKGIVLESQNKLDEARQCYQTIKDECPRSPMAQDIDKYIERVNARQAK